MTTPTRTIKMYAARDLVTHPGSRWPEALELIIRALGAIRVTMPDSDDPSMYMVEFEVPGAPEGATRVDVTMQREGLPGGGIRVHELIWWDDTAPLDPQPANWKPVRDRHVLEMGTTDDGRVSHVLLDGQDVARLLYRVELDIRPSHDVRPESDVRATLHLARLTPVSGTWTASVRVDPGTADLLRRLGWTPPGEDQEEFQALVTKTAPEYGSVEEAGEDLLDAIPTEPDQE